MSGGLLVSGLNVSYGKSHVVFDLGLDVAEGEMLALLGRNGAGKTTTILGILGLLPDARGTVRVDDLDLSTWPAHRRTRRHMAYVPSGARCFPNLTVAENLQLTAHADGQGGGRRPAGGGPAASGGESPPQGGWDLARVYQTFPRLETLRSNLAGGLSGGERQMLAVGRALMGNPRVMLLDEPTEGLAPVIVQSIASLLLDLKSTGVAILLAEQNHQVALRVADRAAFLEKGRVVEELPADRARGSDVLHRILGV